MFAGSQDKNLPLSCFDVGCFARRFRGSIVNRGYKAVSPLGQRFHETRMIGIVTEREPNLPDGESELQNRAVRGRRSLLGHFQEPSDSSVEAPR